MDPPLVNDSTFSSANPSAYTLTEIWPFSTTEPHAAAAGGGLGLRMGGNLGDNVNLTSFASRDGSAAESTVTEQSGGGVGGGTTPNQRKRKGATSEDDSSKIVSTSSANDLIESDTLLDGTSPCHLDQTFHISLAFDLGSRAFCNSENDSPNKRVKLGGSANENDGLKAEAEASSAAGNKSAEQSAKPFEPPKQDYIHVRAPRGQATDSHSLAERARREKISERMKILQDLVPGCNKVIGKALVLDEIINYIQSLQRQVEFLSMKLEAVNSRSNIMNPTMEGFPSKDVGTQPFDVAGMIFGSQGARGYAQGSQTGWLQMQIGGGFEGAT